MNAPKDQKGVRFMLKKKPFHAKKIFPLYPSLNKNITPAD